MKKNEKPKKIHVRRNWDVLFQDFLQSEHISVAEWAKAKLGKYDGHVKNTTTGWIVKKEKHFADIKQKALEKVKEAMTDSETEKEIQNIKKIKQVLSNAMLVVANTIQHNIKEHKDENGKVIRTYFTPEGVRTVERCVNMLKTETGQPTVFTQNTNININKEAVSIEDDLEALKRLNGL